MGKKPRNDEEFVRQARELLGRRRWVRWVCLIAGLFMFALAFWLLWIVREFFTQPERFLKPGDFGPGFATGTVLGISFGLLIFQGLFALLTSLLGPWFHPFLRLLVKYYERLAELGELPGGEKAK